MRQFFLIFCFFISGHSFSQDRDSIIYENYFKIENEIPNKQVYSILTLHSDSTYKWTDYTGEIEDKKQNYLAWEKSESFGKWKLNDNSLVLIRGDIRREYKMRKNYIKWKKLQRGENGGYILRRRLLFDKVEKLYFRNKTANL